MTLCHILPDAEELSKYIEIWNSDITIVEEGLISFGFYGISTIVGYLRPNKVYSCTLDI